MLLCESRHKWIVMLMCELVLLRSEPVLSLQRNNHYDDGRLNLNSLLTSREFFLSERDSEHKARHQAISPLPGQAKSNDVFYRSRFLPGTERFLLWIKTCISIEKVMKTVIIK